MQWQHVAPELRGVESRNATGRITKKKEKRVKVSKGK
jgi:hypothetical protein